MLIRWKSKDKIENKGSHSDEFITKRKKKFKKYGDAGKLKINTYGQCTDLKADRTENKSNAMIKDSLQQAYSKESNELCKIGFNNSFNLNSAMHHDYFTKLTAARFNQSTQLHHAVSAHQLIQYPSKKNVSDLEVESSSWVGSRFPHKKSYSSKGYRSPLLYLDDDPGVMSEVETSCTGFHRGSKQRNSLPVVRTPSKTLERPLGLVFLQFRNETKRALLPNEITSIDTVKALFVRSFSHQLTMEYLDDPHVKIYIHDSNKDMFYELEDLRSHLRDIKDRCVLRLFESDKSAQNENFNSSNKFIFTSQYEDINYFSEPELDSEFREQHMHKPKNPKNLSFKHKCNEKQTYRSKGNVKLDFHMASEVSKNLKTATIFDNLSSKSSNDNMYNEEANVNKISTRLCNISQSNSSQNSIVKPFYSQYSRSTTSVIDEEARVRVEYMERQIASLTGLVQKALTPITNSSQDTQVMLAETTPRCTDRYVSFEKSVSFSDGPPDSYSTLKSNTSGNADCKPTKPAIKSSTLPRCSSQEKEQQQIFVPRKKFSGSRLNKIMLTPETYCLLQNLQKKTMELNHEMLKLRHLTQVQAKTAQEMVQKFSSSFRAMLLPDRNNDNFELSKEESQYKEEMLWLEKDLTGLECTVEDLRGNVINKKMRVNMIDVENMALVLSKASKTVADLKIQFPNLQKKIENNLTLKMEQILQKETFLKEEPDRLESALKRCKKLTGTLVTLKRLASVQDQRFLNSPDVINDDLEPNLLVLEVQSKYKWMKSKNFKNTVNASQDI